MARLILIHDDGRTREYELKGEMQLGRNSKNAIRVPTVKASRNHCKIIEENGQFRLQDLGSSNGTWVNEERVDSVILADNDLIRIGDMELRFEDAVDDPLIGMELDKYEILETIGKGGMGTVYRAHQISLGRDVALKVLRPELAENQEFVEAFQREARMAARLRHPNLIDIYDFGRDEGYVFFSMEYVEGENLLDRMGREGAFPPEEVRQIGIQIAKALAHAHENGILHKDVKPQNILFSDGGHAKLGDLGLAGPIQQDSENADFGGKLIGTHQYIAPERIRRQSEDARSDIYSLSATLFHLLTGRLLFPDVTRKEVIRLHVHGPVPDPAVACPSCPPKLAAVLREGLAKDPAARPASAADYLERLEAATGSDTQLFPPRMAAGLKQKAASMMAGGKLPRFSQDMEKEAGGSGRMPWPILIGSVVLMLIAIGVGGWYVLRMRDSTIADDSLFQEAHLVPSGDDSFGESGELVQDQFEQELKPVQIAEVPPPAETSDQADQEKDTAEIGADQETEIASEAATTWKGVAAQLDLMIESHRVDEGLRLISQFEEMYPEATEELVLANRKRLELQRVHAQRMETTLKSARNALEEGRSSEGIVLLQDVISKSHSQSLKERATSLLMDEHIRLRVLGVKGLTSVLRAGAVYNRDELRSAVGDTMKAVEGSPWEPICQRYKDLAICMDAYWRRGIFPQLEKKTAAVADRVKIEFLGEQSLAVNASGEVVAKVGSREVRVATDQVEMAEWLRVAPAESLKPQEAVGGALVALARGEMAVAKSYAARALAGELDSRLKAELKELIAGRLVMQRFDAQGMSSAAWQAVLPVAGGEVDSNPEQTKQLQRYWWPVDRMAVCVSLRETSPSVCRMRWTHGGEAYLMAWVGAETAGVAEHTGLSENQRSANVQTSGATQPVQWVFEVTERHLSIRQDGQLPQASLLRPNRERLGIGALQIEMTHGDHVAELILSLPLNDAQDDTATDDQAVG